MKMAKFKVTRFKVIPTKEGLYTPIVSQKIENTGKKGKPKTRHNRTSKKGKVFPAGRGVAGRKTTNKQKIIIPKPLTKSDYYEIAQDIDLGYGHREAYMNFMLKAFPNERDRSYATEWAERFKIGTHWGASDKERRSILRKVYGVDR